MAGDPIQFSYDFVHRITKNFKLEIEKLERENLQLKNEVKELEKALYEQEEMYNPKDLPEPWVYPSD